MKKKYLLLTCLAIVVTGASIFFSQTLSRSNAIEDHYMESQYVESTTGLGVQLRNPKVIDEVVNYAKVIIKGEIVEAKHLEEEIKLQAGTPEKAIADKTGGNSSFVRRGTDYMVKVYDVIKGDMSSQEITIYLSDDLNSLHPELKVGDQYIFLLELNEVIGKYIAFHPSASYLRIDKDDHVTPVYKATREFSALGDQSYEKVKAKYKDIISKSR